MSPGPEPLVHPTAALWAARAADGSPVRFASLLTGFDLETLSDRAAICVAASQEADELLGGMESMIRTLRTGSATRNERCVYSVRGPVLWSETMTARANSFGNEDLFVCATVERTFDIVENRVLVSSLRGIARAGTALEGPAVELVPTTVAHRAGQAAAEAARWLEHERLSGIRAQRLRPRDAARLRNGRRSGGTARITAMVEREREPFKGTDLAALVDDATRQYHELTLVVLATIPERSAADGSDLGLSVVDGSIRCGGLSFRHPALGPRHGGGLFYRGVPLVPSELAEGPTPWGDMLPPKRIGIGGAADVEQLLARLTLRERQRNVGRASVQSSRRSSSSSS